MRVHDGVDVRPCSVRFRVDVILERRPRGSFDKITGEVDGDDVVGCQRASHRRTRVDVETVLVATRTAVAVVVDIARTLEHPNRIDELLLDMHDGTFAFTTSRSCEQPLREAQDL